MKELLADLGTEVIEKKKEEKEIPRGEKESADTTWYHEGPESLREARLWLANYSLPKAKERLLNARNELEIPESTRTARRYAYQYFHYKYSMFG